MDVVERVPMYGAEHHARCMAKDAERMAKRPAPAVPCPICGHTDAGEKGGAK